MRIKKNVTFGIGLLLLAAALGILGFPHLSQYLYDKEANRVIQEFNEKVDEMKVEKRQGEQGASKTLFDDLFEQIRQYNEELYLSGQKDLVDPFSYQQVAFSLKQWGFDEDMAGSLNIPKMNIQLPIYLGATDENMARGAAHLSQTSLPIGGADTNAVIAAHRGYSRAAMFRDIEKLEIGDEVIIKNFHDTLVYHVAEIKILQPTDIDKLLIQPGRDLVTLITCHPYRHNDQRYTVYCER